MGPHWDSSWVSCCPVSWKSCRFGSADLALHMLQQLVDEVDVGLGQPALVLGLGGHSVGQPAGFSTRASFPALCRDLFLFFSFCLFLVLVCLFGYTFNFCFGSGEVDRTERGGKGTGRWVGSEYMMWNPQTINKELKKKRILFKNHFFYIPTHFTLNHQFPDKVIPSICHFP